MPSPATSSPVSRQLLLFTKPARPGRVKTRLIGDLSAHQAAQLHRAFVEDVAHRLEGGDFAFRLAWALEEGEEVPAFALGTGRTIPGLRQQGESLGERLFRGLEGAAESAGAVAAVGSDHPSLPLQRVQEAFERLESGSSVVLGPALDGGYYLIGCRREDLHPRIFEDIPWSTDRVLATTLERCRELGLGVELLAPEADVDTPEDLEDLIRWLAAEPEACPRTRSVLESWSLLESRTPAESPARPEARGELGAAESR